MSFIILESGGWWPRCNRCGFVHHTSTTASNPLPSGWLWKGEKIYCPRCEEHVCDVVWRVSTTGHPRLTCLGCVETLVHQQGMTKKNWRRLSAEFTARHSTAELGEVNQ